MPALSMGALLPRSPPRTSRVSEGSTSPVASPRRQVRPTVQWINAGAGKSAMSARVEPLTIHGGLLGLARGTGSFQVTIANRWHFITDTRLDVDPAPSRRRCPTNRWTRTFGAIQWSTHMSGTGPKVIEWFGPPCLGVGTVMAVLVRGETATMRLDSMVFANRIVRAPGFLKVDAYTEQTSDDLGVSSRSASSTVPYSVTKEN